MIVVMMKNHSIVLVFKTYNALISLSTCCAIFNIQSIHKLISMNESTTMTVLKMLISYIVSKEL